MGREVGEETGCHNKAIPGSLPFKAQSGRPCGFSRFHSDTAHEDTKPRLCYYLALLM